MGWGGGGLMEPLGRWTARFEEGVGEVVRGVRWVERGVRRRMWS